MNKAQAVKVFAIVGVVVSAYFLFEWWKKSSARPASGWNQTKGESGCGAWASSGLPAYAMTAADTSQSVWGVPEETGSCPGSPSIMGGKSGGTEGCHCN